MLDLDFTRLEVVPLRQNEVGDRYNVLVFDIEVEV
jgi:hypothetical protein